MERARGTVTDFRLRGDSRRQASIETLRLRLQTSDSVIGLLSYEENGEHHTLGKTVFKKGLKDGEFFFATDPESVSGLMYEEDGQLYITGIDR